jgi:hypothetical protein
MDDAAFDAMLFIHLVHCSLECTASFSVALVKVEQRVLGFSPCGGVALVALDVVLQQHFICNVGRSRCVGDQPCVFGIFLDLRKVR